MKKMQDSLFVNFPSVNAVLIRLHPVSAGSALGQRLAATPMMETWPVTRMIGLVAGECLRPQL
jgi:hypothetical protein